MASMKYLLTLSVIILDVTFATNHGSTIEGKLTKLANEGLGVNAMQREFDKLSYTNTPLDGTNLITKLTGSLNNKFAGHIDALKKLRDVFQQQYNSLPTTSSYDDCCRSRYLEYDSNFKNGIDKRTMCVAISKEASADRKLPNDAILQVMKSNANKNPNLKWQYFGTEQGVLYNYPSFKLNSCENYDPRFRPYYVLAATPKPKDVVVVIDKSGSMASIHQGKSYMEIAKDAARTVVQTLNPNDRVGVIAFSTMASTPQGNLETDSCYSSQLAKATPRNIKYLVEEFINGIRPDGSTNYAKALESAFNYFKNSKTSNDSLRDQVILFFTDGAPSDTSSTILETIKVGNLALQNRIIIMTFGIGGVGTGGELLLNMAKQSTSDESVYDVTPGRYRYLDNPNKLRSAMAQYYSDLSKPSTTSTSALFSAPYEDLFGLGLISAACLPAYVGGALKGVACVDLPIADLFSDITYFRQGELSYAFIADSDGLTLIHPLLPQPMNKRSDPIFVDVSALERSPGVSEVIMSMKDGKSGSKPSLSTPRILSRGNVELDGVTVQQNIISTYYWKPLNYGGFSLCIVIADNDRQAVLNAITPTASAFTYHRLDLKSSGPTCRHYKRVGRKDASTIFLSANAFRDPYSYFSHNDTLNDVNAYEQYFAGRTNNPSNRLQDGVRDSIQATSGAETIWKQENLLNKYVVWRSFGTSDGVLRIYPGVEMAKDYDHTQRPWYKKALAHKGQTVILAPYLDAWGSGYVITLSKAIYEGRSNGLHTSKDTVIGVMEMDFSLNYFNSLINDFHDCNSREFSCMVVDSSGFLVMHDSFVKPPQESSMPKIENVHIIDKEPSVANDLIKKNIMSRAACQDFENIKYRYYWNIFVASSTYPTGIVNNASPGYALHVVAGSNVFLIIKKTLDSGPHSSCSCPVLSSTKKCASTSGTECECPCYSKAHYKYCNNTFDLSNDNWPTCVPLVPHVTSIVTGSSSKTKSLPVCFDNKCSTKTNKNTCYATAACNWCQVKCDNSPLKTPYCASQEVCYYGKEGTQDPYNKNNVKDCKGGKVIDTSTVATDGQESASTSAVIGGAVGGVVVLLIIIIVLFVLFKRGIICKSGDSGAHDNQQGTQSQQFSSHTSTGLYPTVNYRSEVNRQPPIAPTAPPPAYEELTEKAPYPMY